MHSNPQSRFLHVPSGIGDTYGVIGELLTFKVTSADTGGRYSVIETIAQPGGGGPLHTHLSSETFSILEGEFQFTGLEDGKPYTFRALPGATVFVPSGVPHTYTVVSATPGKATLIFSPGTDMEQFFAEAGTPVAPGVAAPAGPYDFPSMIAIAKKHGMTFVDH